MCLRPSMKTEWHRSCFQNRISIGSQSIFIRGVFQTYICFYSKCSLCQGPHRKRGRKCGIKVLKPGHAWTVAIHSLQAWQSPRWAKIWNTSFKTRTCLDRCSTFSTSSFVTPYSVLPALCGAQEPQRALFCCIYLCRLYIGICWIAIYLR